nr:sialate O-acetylesterase [Bifidobacterium dolichotidis]
MSEIVLCTCYVGEVFVCAGQSNMELPVSWASASDPSLLQWEDSLLRQCKIFTHARFEGLLAEPHESLWDSYVGSERRRFSALAAWFGRAMRRMLGVPIGIINISAAGSPIEAWMDHRSASSFTHLGDQLRKFRSTRSARALAEQSVQDVNDWRERCVQQRRDEQDLSWFSIELPGSLTSQSEALNEYHGELLIKRNIVLPKRCAIDNYKQVSALLDLGTMTDADEVCINGNSVGQTSDRYTPRLYYVPAGVLHEGINEIVIRLRVEGENPHVAYGQQMVLRVGDGAQDLDNIEELWKPRDVKYYLARRHRVDRSRVVRRQTRYVKAKRALPNEVEQKIVRGHVRDGFSHDKELPEIQHMDFSRSVQVIDLCGEWQCAVLSLIPDACPSEVVVDWQPTALYYGMVSGCFNFAVRAVLWYQGESNTGEDCRWYQPMLEAMMKAWRKNWQVKQLPFFIVQLPEYEDQAASLEGWATVRDAQWRVMDAFPGESLMLCKEEQEDDQLSPPCTMRDYTDFIAKNDTDTAIKVDCEEVSGAVENVVTVVSLGCGDPYDLHPSNKRSLGERLASTAMAVVMGEDDTTPTPVAVGLERAQQNGKPVKNWMRVAVEADQFHYGKVVRVLWDEQLCTYSGKAPQGFEWVLTDGTIVHAQARITQGELWVKDPVKPWNEIRQLRYAWMNNPPREFVIGTNTTPMPPFRLHNEGWPESTVASV